jgi:CubicO group peptidase (beta-lactamase class C family)
MAYFMAYYASTQGLGRRPGLLPVPAPLHPAYVPRATTPWIFKRAPEPTISYSFNSDRLSIENYLGRNATTGLLIAKDDTILYEHYQYARSDRDRFLSQSMAKTITAMLIGIAISEDKIKSIDDLVLAYVLGLAKTEYGKTSIRDLLHMSSGELHLRKITMGWMTSLDSGAICSANLGRTPSAALPNSTDASLREPNGTTPAWRQKSWVSCCGLPMVGLLPTIFATRCGKRSVPRRTHHGPSMEPARK